MSDGDIVKNIVVKVYLLSGAVMQHTYAMPKTETLVKKLIEDLVKRHSALGKGQSGYVWYNNPNVIYNPDNVSGVEISGITEKEMEKMMRKAQRQIGYVPKISVDEKSI